MERYKQRTTHLSAYSAVAWRVLSRTSRAPPTTAPTACLVIVTGFRVVGARSSRPNMLKGHRGEERAGMRGDEERKELEKCCPIYILPTYFVIWGIDSEFGDGRSDCISIVGPPTLNSLSTSPQMWLPVTFTRNFARALFASRRFQTFSRSFAPVSQSAPPRRPPVQNQ